VEAPSTTRQGHDEASGEHGSPDVAGDIAFQKIASRVKGAAMASDQLRLT
jgi:hypothetical protein